MEIIISSTFLKLFRHSLKYYIKSLNVTDLIYLIHLLRKLSSLSRYHTEQNYKIAEVYTEFFSACINLTTKFRTIVIFKSFVKQKAILVKHLSMPMTFYYTKLHFSKCNL
jgi:hypothetical protein